MNRGRGQLATELRTIAAMARRGVMPTADDLTNIERAADLLDDRDPEPASAVVDLPRRGPGSVSVRGSANTRVRGLMGNLVPLWLPR